MDGLFHGGAGAEDLCTAEFVELLGVHFGDDAADDDEAVLEAGVPEGGGDDVDPAVVAVEADLRDETPDRPLLSFLLVDRTCLTSGGFPYDSAGVYHPS